MAREASGACSGLGHALFRRTLSQGPFPDNATCGRPHTGHRPLATVHVPNFLGSFFNQYAVDIMPGEYTFREHTTGGPPDKIYEESCFLERFRNMMVMEDEDTLWPARATPRAWLDQGQRIVVRRAPSHFGMVSYEILSDVDAGKITAIVDLPSRRPPRTVRLRLRHPRAARIRVVEVNGAPWKDVDRERELIQLQGQSGRLVVIALY